MRTQNPEMKKVLIAADIDSPAVWRLPVLFREAGARVDVLAPDSSRIRLSVFVDRFIPLPETKDAALDKLLELMTDYDFVQFGGEGLQLALAARGDLERFRNILPVEPRRMRMIFTKSLFLEAARDAGLPVPDFEVFPDLPAACAAAEKRMPCVLKQDFNSAGLGVRIVRNEQELRSMRKGLAGKTPTMLQRYVDGRIGTTEILFFKGEPVCHFSAYCVEFCRGEETSPAAMRHLIEPAGIADLVRQVGQLTGFHGLCGIDWMEEKSTGKIRFIEFNGRPTPCYHLGPFAGVDVVHALRDFLAGRPAVYQRHLRHGRLVRLFPEYFTVCVWRLQWWRMLLMHVMPGARRIIPLRDRHLLRDCYRENLGLFRREICNRVSNKLKRRK